MCVPPLLLTSLPDFPCDQCPVYPSLPGPCTLPVPSQTTRSPQKRGVVAGRSPPLSKAGKACL